MRTITQIVDLDNRLGAPLYIYIYMDSTLHTSCVIVIRITSLNSGGLCFYRVSMQTPMHVPTQNHHNHRGSLCMLDAAGTSSNASAIGHGCHTLADGH